MAISQQSNKSTVSLWSENSQSMGLCPLLLTVQLFLIFSLAPCILFGSHTPKAFLKPIEFPDEKCA